MKRIHLAVIAVILMIGVAAFFGVRHLQKSGDHGQVSSSQGTTEQDHQGHGTAGSPHGTAPQNTTEAEDEETPTVEIPEDRQQMLGVKTVEVQIKPLQKVIRTVGRIAYDERRLATINLKFEGWVEKLFIDYTGKYVKKGEPLAEIYSPELVATQQEFLNVLKWAKESSGLKDKAMGTLLSRDADVLVEGAKQRLKLWDISEAQIRNIEESGKPIRSLTLYSPVTGYVVQKQALQGMRVMPGEKLFDIADLSSVWVLSDIYEYELPLVKVGQTAKISLSYFPGKVFSSRIDYIYPTLSGSTRTATVRFTIPNQGGLLKPEMFTNVEVQIDLGKKLSIPDEAVIDTGERQIVYVNKGNGYFEPREVSLGLRADGWREVIKGLKPGERVASAATFLIDSEAQLKNVTPLSGHKH
jgi:membrane fusion protein, copper/silver efflux system